VPSLSLGSAVLLCGAFAIGRASGAQQRAGRDLPVQFSVQWQSFTRTFDGYVDADHIVGGSIVLARHGRIVAHHERGWQDRDAREPVTERTIGHWGSITKTLTAIAIMQLRDRGKLSLDDPITRWVPELRRVHDAYGAIDSVTIGMLLSHAGGFQNPTWPYTDGKPWQPFEPTSWDQLVAMMPYQELLFKPGSRFGYSNPGFIYLARVIESISGDPWETYVQKNILTPLGLTHSYFGVTPYHLAADRSNNYTVTRDGVVANGRDFDPGITIPNGGWNAPVSDLATYAGFLTDTASTVLRHATLEEMWRPRYPTTVPGVADSEESYGDSIGLSFFVVRHGGAVFIGHMGEQAGFRGFLYLNPRTGEAVIANFNTRNDVDAESSTRGLLAVRNAALDLIGDRRE
jgi:CubicO group peptidase (beta-lactamase class C family)